nr:SRPBCC family protein [Sphingomonas sp. CDS-1]
MISVDKSIEVNPAGTPQSLILGREDVWGGLVKKAEYAPPYVKAITSCTIIERDPTGFVREAVIGGETLREHVTFKPMDAVVFDRLPGASAMGRIQNLIEEKDGALMLRFTFDLELENASPEKEAEFAVAMERDYTAAVQTTLERIRAERSEKIGA